MQLLKLLVANVAGNFKKQNFHNLDLWFLLGAVNVVVSIDLMHFDPMWVLWNFSPNVWVYNRYFFLK